MPKRHKSTAGRRPRRARSPLEYTLRAHDVVDLKGIIFREGPFWDWEGAIVFGSQGLAETVKETHQCEVERHPLEKLPIGIDKARPGVHLVAASRYRITKGVILIVPKRPGEIICRSTNTEAR